MARHFTKTEIEEIGQALATRGVKDTDFDELTSLDGDEIIALVKGNKNMKTSVTILLSALSDLGEYYEYAGKATPSGDPGLLGQKLFFLAYESGSATYPNYGGITVSGEIAALKYDPAHGWEKETLASVDPAPRVGSTSLITSGGVATALNGKQNKLNAGTNIRLDDQPDGTTTISATGGTIGPVNFDEVPTQGSYNAVYSNGIFNAIQNVKNTVLTKADDSDVMHLGGNKNETATGVKNFSSGIVSKSVTINETLNVGGTGTFQNNVNVKGNLTVDQDISEGGTRLVDKYMGKNDAYTKAETNVFLAKKQDKLEAGRNITLTPNPTTGNTIISAAGGTGGDYTVDVGMDTGAFQNNTISSSTWAGGYYSAIYRAFSDTPIDVNPGYCSFAEGIGNRISGDYCHAEGYFSSVESNGSCGHAEGGSSGPFFVSYGGHVSGEGAHAEGFVTYAQGHASHTEGNHSEAYGNFSHAEGYYTKTLNQNEHASGIANEPILNVDEHDVVTDASIFSIGIGTVTPRSGQEPLVSRKNAFLVMDDGDTYIYGVGGYNGTNYGSPNVKSVQTVINSGGGGGGEYVDLISDQDDIGGHKGFVDAITVHGTIELVDTASYEHEVSASSVYIYPDNSEIQNYGTRICFDDFRNNFTRVATAAPRQDDDAVNLAYLQTNYKKYRAGSNITFSQPDAGGVITISSTGGGGGTGDYVDLTTNQTVGGEKLFTDGLIGDNTVTINDTLNYSRVDPDTQEVITWTGSPIHLTPDSYDQDNPGLRVLDQDNAYATIKIADPIEQEDGVNLGYLNTALSSANFQPRLTAGTGISITNSSTRISTSGVVYTSGSQEINGQKTFNTGISLVNTGSITFNESSTTLTQELAKKQNLLEAGSNITLTPLASGNVRISATGGSGGSGDIYTEIYYTDLMELRDAGELVPGMKYRIIDYVTRVDNTNGMGSESARLNSMRSIEQQFDIVVTALSNTKLSEEAYAVPHKFDTEFELYWYGFTLPLIEMTTVTFTDEQTFDVYRFYFKHDHNKEIWVTTDFKCFPVFMSPSEYTMMGDHAAQAQIAGTEFTLKNGVAYNTSGDTQAFKVRNSHYFDSCNLSAWKIWYTLDNNVERYTWSNYAVPRYMYHDNNGTQVSLEFQKQVTSADGTRYYLYGTAGQVASLVPAGSDAIYLAAVPKEDSVQRPFPYSGEAVLYCLDSDYTICENDTISTYVPSGTATDNPTKYVGNGVIYRMIDEWGNDCPYDFKNIQYHRRLDSYGLPIGSNGTWYYVFTFNMYSTYDHSTYDASIVQNTQYGDAVTGDTFTRRTYDNVLKPCSVGYVTGTSDNTYGDKFVLNQIIFYGSGNTSGSTIDASGSSNNEFGYDCFNITFGNYAYGNKFGERCSHIVLGFKNYDNIFSNECTDIMTVSGVVEHYNTSDTNHISGCKFGTGCSDIKFTGTTRENITVGPGCKTLTFDSLMRNVTIGGRCMYLAIRVSTSASAYTDYVQNVCIASGTHGTNSTTGMLTIGVTNVNADYEVKIGQTSGGALKEYCEANLALA